ncbi:hypothetical protein [Natrinema altunense]|uniref:Uncharacterized protein n=2 Tax=Natrinema altunense TaxID=222984 RepID=L9ZCG5_NATA2|nr:hypothetical protein [Natrinema altunense]ELY83696.1 hypothetical protein C485_18127 [Natrinema altunense JCM 12890]RZH68397.1 hypothetical protein ELS17_02715 [Natrinema altunense]
MSTQPLQPPTDAEPTRTTTRTRPTPSSDVADPRPAADRAQRMFSHGNTDRLENLIDEWNAAVATADTERGS